MKKMLGWILAVMVLGTAVRVVAEEKAASEKKPAMEKKYCCESVFSKLNLTDEQKQKIAELQEGCKGGSCPVTRKQKMEEGLKKILTPEQFKQWQDACTETTAKGCPAGGKAKGKAKAKAPTE